MLAEYDGDAAAAATHPENGIVCSLVEEIVSHGSRGCNFLHSSLLGGE